MPFAVEVISLDYNRAYANELEGFPQHGREVFEACKVTL